MTGQRNIAWAVTLSLVALLCACEAPERRTARLPREEIERLVQSQKKARELYEKALALDDDIEEKKALYLRALEHDPSFGKANNNLGALYLEQNNFPNAVRFLRRAVTSLPNSSAPRFNLGLTYEQIGRLQSAEEQYLSAVHMAPEEPDYLQALARVYIKRQRHLGKAREILKKALTLESRPERIDWIKRQLSDLKRGIIPSPRKD